MELSKITSGYSNIKLSGKDEVVVLNQAVNVLNNSLSKTYANIAYQRDLLVSEKNKLLAILSALDEAIIVLDIHRNIIYLNKGALDLTGLKEDYLLGKTIDEAFLIQDRRGAVIPSQAFCAIDLIGGQNAIYNPPEALTLVKKDGKKVQVRLISRSINTSTLANLGCLISIRDLTKEHSLESMQIDFVSMASHELRTPLTSILGYLNVLIDEGKNSFTPEQKDFLNKILTASQQLSGLVGNLLNVSRVERGAISVNTKPLDWQKVLSQVVDENKLQAAQKSISLELSPPDKPLPLASADSVRITEVLNNLITNAIAYTPEGGSIKIGAKAEEDKIITSVSDTGRGIPREALPQLFTKFYRVSNAQDISSNSKGTGLGLYLSKTIIELHRGKIWVQSQLNQGSTFYFSLPIAREQTSGVIHPPQFTAAKV